MDALSKRQSVMKDYDLIADQYCAEYGVELEAKEILYKFKTLLRPNSKVVDLGGGSGKVTKFLIDNDIDATCYDFSEKMMINAMRLFPNLPYILDDFVNLRIHFSTDSIDGFVALYSLFHFPKEEMEDLLSNINSLLKINGYFLFSLQLGSGEAFIDEPYLGAEGKSVVYMNYYSREEIDQLLRNNNFEIISIKEERETSENSLGDGGNDAIYILSKKIG